jgi:hypothetical protein
MAAITDRITVFVKLLNGEILSLEVDPSIGLKGVADTLSRSDPVTFPFELTVVSFMDEEQTLLTDQTMLMVLVQEPIESIVRVDTFNWRGNAAYRLRIKAHRTKSMHWMCHGLRGPYVGTDLDIRRQSPQLFDICYYLADKTFMNAPSFMVPFGGLSLDHLEVSKGKCAKCASTVLKKLFMYRRDNVGLDEFDDDISRLPTEEEQIDWSEFYLKDDAITRISALITTWIVQQNF